LLAIFLRLGLTSFGGPIAHIGLFRHEFVLRRRWFSEQQFAEMLALCQFLPGPASSQLGMAIGLSRGGVRGSVCAWLGFTLPSALLMVAIAQGLRMGGALIPPGLLQGLQLVAVAVVIQAVWAMAASFCTTPTKIALALGAAAGALTLYGRFVQVAIIAAAGIIGLFAFRRDVSVAHQEIKIDLRRRIGLLLLCVFALLLVLLPLAARIESSTSLALIDSFYRAGALVFGGGHVILPILHEEVAAHGWVSDAVFVAGYSAAQALPGPLFTFSAFLGASTNTGVDPLVASALCLLAIFAPSFLLVLGSAPFWNQLRASPASRCVFAGINSSVVGLLLAALYRPIATTAVHHASDVVVVAAALLALVRWRAPPWAVVATGGLCGWILSALV
jgi:chromate transporter